MGECQMFYKEWSTDTFWAPEIGLLLLPAGHSPLIPRGFCHILTLSSFESSRLPSEKLEPTWKRKLGRQHGGDCGLMMHGQTWKIHVLKQCVVCMHVDTIGIDATFNIIHSGTWMLNELEWPYPPPSLEALQLTDLSGGDNSGVEMISHHKLTASA